MSGSTSASVLALELSALVSGPGASVIVLRAVVLRGNVTWREGLSDTFPRQSRLDKLFLRGRSLRRCYMVKVGWEVGWEVEVESGLRGGGSGKRGEKGNGD